MSELQCVSTEIIHIQNLPKTDWCARNFCFLSYESHRRCCPSQKWVKALVSFHQVIAPGNHHQRTEVMTTLEINSSGPSLSKVLWTLQHRPAEHRKRGSVQNQLNFNKAPKANHGLKQLVSSETRASRWHYW